MTGAPHAGHIFTTFGGFHSSFAPGLSAIGAATAMLKSCPGMASLIVVTLGMAAASASAQSPPPAAAEAAPAPAPAATVSGVTITARKPTHVSGVTVIAPEPCILKSADGKAEIPEVVDTFPRSGSTIQPGLIFLRVTFSEPMSRCSYFLDLKDGVNHPIILKAPVQISPDRKSFFFAALVGANTRNYMWIGKAVDPASSGNFHRSAPSPIDFRSRHGVSAQSYKLRFSTSAGPMVKTVAAALAADPEMPKFVAQTGGFLRVGLPERSDKVGLWRCTDCDADLRTMYAQGAESPDPGPAGQPPTPEDSQSSQPSSRP